MNTEPTAIVAAIRLCLLAAITFGLALSDVQLVASMLAVEAVLGLFLRSQVTPVDSALTRGDSGQAWAPLILVFVIGFILGALCYANGILVG
jgi:hypothetical protein